MDREINIESIRVLEQQIEGHRDERNTVHLKRVRNSLLNVSTLPPEILGDIFHQNVILESPFDGLRVGSYNFLLVCHHWFEVASHTPELWSCWGDNLQDWKKRYRCCPAAPLDLVLDRMNSAEVPLDDVLRSALQDRAARDTIRQVHLWTNDPGLLSSILSSLTAGRDRLQPSSLESVILWSMNHGTPVDASEFFTHHHPSKLRYLDLDGCTVSSLDHFLSQTTLLTTLDLSLDKTSSVPTSQLFSILASNPHLQDLTLSIGMVPLDGSSGSSFRVALHHLERLHLIGRLPHLFWFLYRLEYPDRMEDLSITLSDQTTSDISPTIGPYLRDHVQRRGESRSGLSLHLACYDGMELRLGDASETHPLMWILGFTRIAGDRVSRRHIAVNDLYPHLPGLKVLELEAVDLSAVFPMPDNDGPPAYEKIPPSLQHLSLDFLFLDDHRWSPLTAFLSHRASTGNPIVSLTIGCSPHMCQGVVEGISEMVGKFEICQKQSRCDFGHC